MDNKISSNFKGYMSGMLYILSAEALQRFHTQIKQNRCSTSDEGDEDLEVGRCLSNQAIAVDTRDDDLQTLFPVQPEFALSPWGGKIWYQKNQFYPIKTGVNCCSSNPIAFHKINSTHKYFLNYLFYRVHPFGLPQKDEKLPDAEKLEKTLLRSMRIKL